MRKRGGKKQGERKGKEGQIRMENVESNRAIERRIVCARTKQLNGVKSGTSSTIFCFVASETRQVLNCLALTALHWVGWKFFKKYIVRKKCVIYRFQTAFSKFCPLATGFCRGKFYATLVTYNSSLYL